MIRGRDGLDVNIRLVRVGAAAPYFYRGRHGRYWRLLDRLGRRARAHHFGLWGAWPGHALPARRGRGNGAAAVSAESIALIPRCSECQAAWLPADEERWRAYLGGDDLDEAAEVFFYCPDCAEREFGTD